MDKGLGKSLNIKLEPLPIPKNTSLEEKVYSEKYTELSYFPTNNPVGKKIRDYFRVGLIAKNGFEKASKIYNEKSEPFDESPYLLERGETPTLLHKYAKNIKKFNKIIVKEMIKDFEYDVQEVAFKYRGLSEKNYKGILKRKRKLNHFESLDYVLKNCKMKEIETRNDVVEALMLAQEMGLDAITINRWDRRRVDNKVTGKLISDLFERHYQGGSKAKIYNEIKEEILKTEGRTMSKSTFYRYLREIKEPIKLIPLIQETDISNVQSNAG